MCMHCHLTYAITAVCLLLSHAVIAQWAQDIERPWHSRITTEWIHAIVDAVEPDESQLTVIDDLHRTHTEEFSKLAQEGIRWKQIADQELVELKARVFPDDLPAERAHRKVISAKEVELRRHEADWADRLAAMDDVFDDNVFLILYAEQQASWHKLVYEHQWDRVRDLRSPVPLATVRITDIVEQMHLEPATIARLEPIVQEYEILVNPIVDQVLAEVIKRARSEWREAKRMIDFGARAAQATSLEHLERLDRARYGQELAVKRRELAPQATLRTINKGYAERIAAELSPEDATTFLQSFVLQSEPDSYRLTRLHRAVQRLTSIDQLPQERKSIYADALVTLNESLEPLELKLASLREASFAVMWSDSYNIERRRDLQKQIELVENQRHQVIADAYALFLKALSPEELAIAAPASAAQTAEMGGDTAPDSQ